ncbi:MAG: PAS domain-containing protein, partial [Lachnospiraceae bacterium]|nr:PAS domain-containing protein [Lachnospiraceae bacterium]
MSYQTMIARYISITKEFKCAIAIFNEDGKPLHLNEEAMDIIGYNVINLELLPGRYVGNEQYFDNLRRYKTVFTHKALLKAGTETFKIRGMMHLINPRDEANGIPETYCLAFDVREERIFGSVTLERIVEHSGFIAFHWLRPEDEVHWEAKYVSNTISKFGYTREEFYNKDLYWKDLIPEDEQQRLVDEFIENWKNGRNEYTREFDIITSDGEVIPAHD